MDDFESAYEQAYAAKKNQSMASDPRNWPVNQEMKAQGRFSAPTTIDTSSIWKKLENVAGNIVSGFQSLNRPAPNPTPQPKMTTEQAAQQIVSQNPGWRIAGATPTPTPAASTDQFRFQMGQKDYSYVRPQLQRLFEAKGNPPVAQYIDEFIKAGNQYGVDPRVLVTIANNESSLGKRYPTESFNPFGYLVDVPVVPQGVTGAEKEQAIWQGLRNAGFTSMPHAIDRLTYRFARQPSENYQTFYQDPTISNLQLAYNANAGERANYLQNAGELLQYFQNQQMLSAR